MAFAYTSRAHFFVRQGNSTAAIDDVKKALALYEQAENIQGQALSYNVLGNAYFDMSQWVDADRYYRQARAIFNQTGDVLHLAFTSNNLAEIARYQGRLDDALTFFQEALRSLERDDTSPYVLGSLHIDLGATFLRRGDIDAALLHLHTSQDKFSKARDFLPELYRHFAEAALLAGTLPEAEEHGQHAFAMARELTIRGEEGNSLRVLGLIAKAQGQLEQAAAYLNQSLAIQEELGDAYRGREQPPGTGGRAARAGEGRAESGRA